MSHDTIVLYQRNQYQFPTVERAAEARDWVAARGALAMPGEFAQQFRDADRLPGFPGGSTIPG